MADAVKDPKRDSAENIQQNLLAGKYKSAEELATAYTELEKKLGEMDTKHKAELQQVQTLAEQYRQPAEWAQQHGQRLLQEHQQLQAALQQAQQQRANGAQQPANGADPLSWFTPVERQALYSEFARQYHQQGMVPYLQQFYQQHAVPAIQRELTALSERMMAQNRAATEVLWSAIEAAAPEDRLAQIREQQALQLKYSDPKSYDPRSFATEEFKTKSELIKSQARIAELEKRIEERERAQSAPVAASGGTSPFKKEGEKPAPKTRDERIRSVVDTVREQVGPEQFRQAFPAA